MLQVGGHTVQTRWMHASERGAGRRRRLAWVEEEGCHMGHRARVSEAIMAIDASTEFKSESD